MLDTALKQIATMQPAQLPEVELPRVPDLSAAEPLAAIAHGNPAPLLESAKNIDLDNATISAALGQARTLVAGTIRDLVGIATQLVRQALPTALGFLSLDPSARAAALAQLRALISQHLGMAAARVQRLMGDLSAAAQSLQPVAQRPVHSALADAPVIASAAIYLDDIFVPFEDSLATGETYRDLRPVVTNRFQHNGISEDGAGILGELFRAADER